MEDSHFVRELSLFERPTVQDVKTGERLPDGTVLLWRRDMDRMSLRELRGWLSRTILDGAAGIVFGDSRPGMRLLDEEYNV